MSRANDGSRSPPPYLPFDGHPRGPPDDGIAACEGDVEESSELRLGAVRDGDVGRAIAGVNGCEENLVTRLEGRV